jgi:hypothetical protein
MLILSLPFMATVLDGLPRKSYVDAVISPGRSHGYNRSGTVTAKGKKGMLGFMTDFLNSNKRPEISTPYDPVHLTHVGFNFSTGEFTGLPKSGNNFYKTAGFPSPIRRRTRLLSWRSSSSTRKVVAMFGIRWATPLHREALNHHLSPARHNPPTLHGPSLVAFIPTVSWFLSFPISVLPDSQSPTHEQQSPAAVAERRLPASLTAWRRPRVRLHGDVKKRGKTKQITLT